MEDEKIDSVNAVHSLKKHTSGYQDILWVKGFWKTYFFAEEIVIAILLFSKLWKRCLLNKC